MKLADKHMCTGCGACVNSCPKNALEMQPDQYGFLFPVITRNCINCKKCEQACPVLLKRENNGRKETISYAAYSDDRQTRNCSSSGGMIPLFSRAVLSSKGAVYGAAYETDFLVKHICVENASKLPLLRGAKYSQSDIGFCYREIKKRLESGQEVLFSGTPCQVVGLYAFLGKAYDNLILIDTVCHSVPSPLAWKKYVEYRSAEENGGILPIRINQRSKETGWSSYKYSSEFVYPDKKQTLIQSEDDIYMQLFSNRCISRESCSNCLFKGYDRISDITLGDFWGIWNTHPEMDDNMGTSLVLIHSQKGKDLFDKVSSELTKKRTELEEAASENPALIRAFPDNPDREEYLKKACKGRYDILTRTVNKRPSYLKRIKRKIKSLSAQ